MDDILEIAAPGKGGIPNILLLHYNSIANEIIAKLTKSAAFVALVWGLQL